MRAFPSNWISLSDVPVFLHVVWNKKMGAFMLKLHIFFDSEFSSSS